MSDPRKALELLKRVGHIATVQLHQNLWRGGEVSINFTLIGCNKQGGAMQQQRTVDKQVDHTLPPLSHFAHGHQVLGLGRGQAQHPDEGLGLCHRHERHGRGIRCAGEQRRRHLVDLDVGALGWVKGGGGVSGCTLPQRGRSGDVPR